MARVTLQEYCDQARELIDKHQYSEAIAICRHILKRYPRHIRTYQILGEACLQNGEVAEAVDIFKRLLENADPENLTAYAGLGVAYHEKGQLADAIWYMERAFELAPNNEDTRSSLRQLYYQRDGVEPERIRHSKAALARLYARGGQYRQAIEEFRRLLEAEENSGRIDLKVSLAETLWRDGRREQAAELAREILQTAPDCLKALLLLGKITIEKGRQEEGKVILEKTRGLDPENRAAQALFGEASPLPPQVVLIPRMEPLAATPMEAVVEPTAAAAAPAAEAAVAEAEVAPQETAEVAAEPVPAAAPATEALAPEAEIAPQETTEGTVEPSPTVVAPPSEAIAPEAEMAPQPAEAAAVPPAISEEAEPIAAAEVPTTEAPVVAVEPAPPAIAEETAPVATTQEPTIEEIAPGTAELSAPPATGETALVAAPEKLSEEAPVVAVEPVVTPVEEKAAPAAMEAAPAIETAAGEIAAAQAEAEPAPVPVEAVPKRKRTKRAAPQATVLEAGAAAAAGPLSDIERFQLLVEQKPKNDELRLALARAYRDGSQMKPALEQYAKLVRAKQKLLPDVIADVEGIVASRPDNLDAHELLADLYSKSGQLQKALERYRWVLEKLREGTGN